MKHTVSFMINMARMIKDLKDALTVIDKELSEGFDDKRLTLIVNTMLKHAKDQEFLEQVIPHVRSIMSVVDEYAVKDEEVEK